VNSTNQYSVWSENFFFFIPEYFLRDEGPAGGLIFYLRPSYSDDWIYLEAASASTEWSGIKWAPVWDEVYIGIGETVIGYGEDNTMDIIEYFGTDTTYAAQLCGDLTYEGFSDWFLPSRDELNQMYSNLYKYEVGSFSSDYYWSSSEYNRFHAWHRDFGSETHENYARKDGNGCVRAIRAF